MRASHSSLVLVAALVVGGLELSGSGPGWLRPPPDDAILHSSYDALVRDVAGPEGVDYRALLDRADELADYLETLAHTDPASLSPDARFALWLNAYNAFTMQLILEAYPGIRSIRNLRRPWDTPRWVIGGRRYSLQEIENIELGERFQDPRFHFAINCASVSCPAVRHEAYVGARLEEQLTAATRAFLSQPDRGYIRKGPRRIGISQIFRWYAPAFEAAGGTVLGYIASQLPPEEGAALRAHMRETAVDDLPYDWDLNDAPRAAP